MSYLPNDPGFKYGYYNIYNPRLWKTVEESKSINDRLRKAIGENFEMNANGIASLGDFRDEAKKVMEEQELLDKSLREKDYNAKISLGRVPADRMKSISSSDKPVDEDEDIKEDPDIIFDNPLKNKVYQFINNFKNQRDKTNNLATITPDNGEYYFGSNLITFTGDKSISVRGVEFNNINDQVLEFFVVNQEAALKKLLEGMKDDDKKKIYLFYNSAGLLTGTSKKVKLIKTLSKFAGAGFSGSGIKFYKSDDELIERLAVLMGSTTSGNKSKAVKNEIFEIIDKLYENKSITRSEYNQLYSKII